MKTVFLIFSLLSSLLLIAPTFFVRTSTAPSLPASTEITEEHGDGTEKDNAAGESKDSPDIVMTSGGGVISLSLEDYVRGVLWAELYLSFDDEAWKALAVCVRSFALYQTEHGIPLGDDNSGACAYLSDADARARFGALYDQMKEKAANAADATKGEVLLYEGDVALAMFHAMSKEYTASSESVLGTSVPYLISRTTEDGEITETGRTFTLTREDCMRNIGTDALPATFAYDKDGRVATVTFSDGTVLSGRDFRTSFSLPSTDIQLLSRDEGSVTLCISGYGHGIGMSQWGAQALACAGEDYRAILSHYYPGTELSDLPK